jgi:hypothetical protein
VCVKKIALSLSLLLASDAATAGIHGGVGLSPFGASQSARSGWGFSFFLDYLPGEEPEARFVFLDVGILGSWSGGGDTFLSSVVQGRIAKNFWAGARAGLQTVNDGGASAGFSALTFSLFNPARPFEATVDVGVNGGAFSRFSLGYRFF